MNASFAIAPLFAAVTGEDVLVGVLALLLLVVLAAFFGLRGRMRAALVERTRAEFSEEILSRFRRGMETRIGVGGVTPGIAGGGVSGAAAAGMERLLAYANIAEALSGGYECVYYIDLKTNHFDQFRSQGLYESLKVEKAGEDFFGLTQRLLPSTMHPDDVPRMAAAFTPEAMREATQGDRVFSITYRLNIEGDYLWYNFRAVRATSDRDHLVAAVSNVDEASSALRVPEAAAQGAGFRLRPDAPPPAR